MRRSLGPRLFLRQRTDGPAVWYIRDGLRMQSTGLSAEQSEAAEKVLYEYAGGSPISVSLPALTRPETVYFASCAVDNFPVKIGAAFNVAKRITQLQCSLPYPLILLATTAGGTERERALHLAFRETRLQGEWFSRTPELMEFIKTATDKEQRKAIKDGMKKQIMQLAGLTMNAETRGGAT